MFALLGGRVNSKQLEILLCILVATRFVTACRAPSFAQRARCAPSALLLGRDHHVEKPEIRPNRMQPGARDDCFGKINCFAPDSSGLVVAIYAVIKYTGNR